AEFVRKGGRGAFRALLDTLEAGDSVALTADVPKIARIAGRGIVMLARESGRPIFPIALPTRRRHALDNVLRAPDSGCPIFPIAPATSRRYVLDNWDKTTINLPFSRGGAVCGDPV